MAGGQIGGQGSLFKRAVWVFIAASITVAVWNTFPHQPKAFMGELRHKSVQMRSAAADVVDWLNLDVGDGGKPGDEPGKQRSPRKHAPHDPPVGASGSHGQRASSSR